MYISKLKLQGFKSFFNKTDLTFGEGVTVVVGPNGCGKSNIVDAIRWVLGEQKNSILRSTKMEDVIFNGTKNRKPLGFCEASMLIHNNRGILPIEYNDVEITRRLYRSGESQFYINKTQCRLKDIHNLFVDTGMSSNAYSVIELKMVDSILSNNASERRKMFEEAAGINNYKQQRQAALRKITSTHADMERVNDIILEVNNSLKNLKLQVKRYERYEKLTKNQKKLTIEITCAEIQVIKNKLFPLQIKLDQIKNKQSSLSGQMNLDETLAEQVQSQFEEKKSELSTCQKEISNLENKLSDLNSNLLVWSEKISGNDNQKNHFIDELQHNKESLNNTTRKIDELKSKKKKLQPEIRERQSDFKNNEIQYQAIKDKYDKLSRNQEDLKKKTELIYLKIREEEGVLERLKNTISELEQNSEIHNKKIEHYNQKLENSTAESNLARANVESQEKKNSILSKEVTNLKIVHSNLEENILSIKEEKNILQSKISTFTNQIEFYTNIVDNHEGRSAGVKRILTNRAKYPFVLGVLSDIIEVDNQYQLAVETALGECCNYLVVDTQKNANSLIEKTKNSLSIFSLDNLPEVLTTNFKYPGKLLIEKVNCQLKLKTLLQLLIGDVCILPADKAELDSKISNQYPWIDTSGNYFSKGYIFKSPGEKHESIIGRKQKLELLEIELINGKKSIGKLNATLKDTLKNADITRNKLQLKTDELDSAIQNLNNFEQQLIQQDYVATQHLESILECRDNQKIIASQIIDFNIKLKTIKDVIHELRIEYEKSSKENDIFQGKIAEDRSAIRVHEQNVQDARIKLLEIKKENEGLEYRVDTFISQDKELKVRLTKYNSELLGIDKENKNLRSSISEGKIKLVNISESLEQNSREKDDLEKAYNKAYVELQRLQSGIRDRQKQKDNFLNIIREYEITIADGNNEIIHHRARINELYNEELADNPINLDEYDLPSRKTEIENLQLSLERIGPVNLAVADEYERESERCKFLTDQYIDLQQAEKTINDTIEKLDGEAQKKFMDTFTAIQENFTKTYSLFFVGGEGHLRLVGENDPLEAEIEIIAQPPGKKTQTLRMLSAGEKALTAIALLFAIYLVKPSPFCILDEVDAPLDDTNISKFAKVLKEFSNKTQFIVVTHNKLTMEKADYMYGVTQVEEGVSKIVSVKFSSEKLKEMA